MGGGGDRTVVNPFGNRLENFDVKRGSATVVPVVLVFFVADDAVCSFGSRKLDGGSLGYPRNDLSGIEREDGPVSVDGIGIQDFWEVHGLENRFGEVRSERVFIGTGNNIDGRLARAQLGKDLRSAYLEYLRAFAGETIYHARNRSAGGGTERTDDGGRLVGWDHTKHTVECLGLSKEPFEPASFEVQLVELFESPLLVYLRIVGELSAFDETKDDRVFEPSQDRANPIEGEGIPGEHIVGLHDWLSGRGEGKSGRGGYCTEGWCPAHRCFISAPPLFRRGPLVPPIVSRVILTLSAASSSVGNRGNTGFGQV